jgi:hypothetical protein
MKISIFISIVYVHYPAAASFIKREGKIILQSTLVGV